MCTSAIVSRTHCDPHCRRLTTFRRSFTDPGHSQTVSSIVECSGNIVVIFVFVFYLKVNYEILLYIAQYPV